MMLLVAGGGFEFGLGSRNLLFHLHTSAQQLVEEAFNAGQDRRTFARVVDSAAQCVAALYTMSEPRDKLFHLARRAVHVFLHQHLEICADHLVAISVRWLVVATGLSKLANLAEDPWIRRSGAADHHSVATAFGNQRDSVFRRANVAIADHRNAH